MTEMSASKPDVRPTFTEPSSQPGIRRVDLDRCLAGGGDA